MVIIVSNHLKQRVRIPPPKATPSHFRIDQVTVLLFTKDSTDLSSVLSLRFASSC